MKFGEKLIQTKLSSRLSRKGCRLLFSPVLLRKFTNSDNTSGSRDHRTSGRREGSGLQEMIRENSQKTFSFRFELESSSSISKFINSLEWFSELEHLKNILEINDGHFGAKKVRILLGILTYWQPYKYEVHEKIRSMRPINTATKHFTRYFRTWGSQITQVFTKTCGRDHAFQL